MFDLILLAGINAIPMRDRQPNNPEELQTIDTDQPLHI